MLMSVPPTYYSILSKELFSVTLHVLRISVAATRRAPLESPLSKKGRTEPTVP